METMMIMMTTTVRGGGDWGVDGGSVLGGGIGENIDHGCELGDNNSMYVGPVRVLQGRYSL